MSAEHDKRLGELLAGRRVECNIGQVTGRWKSVLEREVRKGRLVKWRGYWFPVSGASWGIGHPKLCYGAPAVRDRLNSK